MELHSAHLDNLNVDFAYIDSGPPPQSDDYTTLVCIHGNTYHAQAFQRLVPLAPAHNIRLIALNRRDYLDSTPFTPTELAELFSTDAFHHQKFLFDRGLEIAYFLLWVIKELKIPPTRTNHNDTREKTRRGGLALLGWSLGNITSLAFLSNLSRYPREVVDGLEPYLRHYLIYEVVYQFLGIPSPEGAYHPLWDDAISLDHKAQAIDAWYTSYFSHAYFSSPSPPSTPPPFSSPCLSLHAPGSQRTLSSLTLRTPLSPPPGENPTSANRTPKEYEAITDPAPVMRSEIAFYGTVGEETLFAQYRDALSSGPSSSSVFPFTRSASVKGGHESHTPNAHSTTTNDTSQNGLPSPSPSSSPSPLPNLRITVLDATHTVWNIIYATWCISSDLEQWSSHARAVRPVSFKTIQGANHYAVWDDPETLMKTLVECL